VLGAVAAIVMSVMHGSGSFFFSRNPYH
jgi:hypothetical protein